MTDPRLAWFAMGATCSAVLFGWPWHRRRSINHENTKPPTGPPPLKPRRDIRSITFPDPSPDRQPTNPFTGDPVKPKPEIVPGFYGPQRTVRWFINNPLKISDCGGPCTAGPTYCDCGELWVDVPTSYLPPPSNP